MQNSVFYDAMPCGSCKNRRSSEISVVTRATRRHITEDGIHYSHGTENLKYNIFLVL
jgi:hypothetical protein